MLAHCCHGTPFPSGKFSSFCRPFSLLHWDRQGLSGFSFAWHRRSKKIHFQRTCLVTEECVHRVHQMRVHAVHWHEHFVVLRVLFPRQSLFDRLVVNVAVCVSVDDFVVTGSRKWPPVFLCAARLCFELEAPGVSSLCLVDPLASLRLPLSSPWFLALVLVHFWFYRWKNKRSGAGGMSNIVDFNFCGISTTARRLCSTIRRTLRMYTTPSSVLTRCTSLSLLWLPTRRISTCRPASVRVSQIPFPLLEGEQAQIHKLQHFSRCGRPIAR